MSNERLLTFPIRSLSVLSACSAFAVLAGFADEAKSPEKFTDVEFLQSVKAPQPEKSENPCGPFFARILAQKSELEFLASHKRYGDLLKVIESFQGSLEQAPSHLPDKDPQRSARFIAASRSLERLSKAIHTFMWDSQESSLFEATEKLGKLLVHIESLIQPEELALALEFQKKAKS